jgi:hypothetical protein
VRAAEASSRLGTLVGQASPFQLEEIPQLGRIIFGDYNLRMRYLFVIAMVLLWATQADALTEKEFGGYHALVIGINDYEHLPKLSSAINDASAIADVLRQRYGFKVTMLLNANRDAIIRALDKYRAELTPDDNLVIFFAGHSILERELNVCYWFPIDAEPDSQVAWIPIPLIKRSIRAMVAKHVMVISDSCFSSTLTRWPAA